MTPSEPAGDAVLFLVPARGRSKGVKGKNLRAVGGIPLVARAVWNASRASISVGDPSRNAVVCSTDSAEVAAVAREWGAEVPFVRPAALAADTASSDDVVVHALDSLESLGRHFTAVARVQPTSPLALPEDLVSGVRLCLDHRVSVATVCPSRPPSWTFRREADGRLEEVVPDPPGVVRRQDYPPYCTVNGALSVTLTRRLRAARVFFEAGVTLGSMMPVERSVDVDGEDDLALGELLLAARSVQSVAFEGRTVGDAAGAAFLIADCRGAMDAEALALSLERAAQAGADAVAAPVARWTGAFRERARALKLVSIATLADARETAPPAAQQWSAAWIALEAASPAALRSLAETRKPIVVSVGRARLSEVARVVDALPSIALEAPSLSAVRELRSAFSRPVGMGCCEATSASLAAALGSSFVASPLGDDSWRDFAKLAQHLRGAERALGAHA